MYWNLYEAVHSIVVKDIDRLRHKVSLFDSIIKDLYEVQWEGAEYKELMTILYSNGWIKLWDGERHTGDPDEYFELRTRLLTFGGQLQNIFIKEGINEDNINVGQSRQSISTYIGVSTSNVDFTLRISDHGDKHRSSTTYTVYTSSQRFWNEIHEIILRETNIRIIFKG